MGNHLTPLEVSERLIGPPEGIGPICSVHPKSPYQWRDKSGRREAGDLPYTAHQRALLTYSDQRGLGLTALHLIFGAAEAEVDAILRARATRAEAAE